MDFDVGFTPAECDSELRRLEEGDFSDLKIPLKSLRRFFPDRVEKLVNDINYRQKIYCRKVRANIPRRKYDKVKNVKKA